MLTISFEGFWSELPSGMKKGDKVRAKLRFERVIKAGHEAEMLAALTAYQVELRVETWKTPMHLATWLGSAVNERWREWGGELDRSRLGHLSGWVGKSERVHGLHHCQYCEPPHDWQCFLPEVCGMQREMACGEFSQRFGR